MKTKTIYLTDEQIKYVRHKCDFDMSDASWKEDIDYLVSYIKDSGINIDIDEKDLGALYNLFSGERWSAIWEDNAEGEFIQWLEEHKILK